MRIHAIKTGTMSIKESYYAAKGKTRIVRLASVMMDRRFRDVPVYTWAIEHPEGAIVIDTGMSAEMRDYSYFPAIQRPYWTTQYRFSISENEEIGPQLAARGISPESVRWLIMTHSHFDHSGGLHHFREAEVIFTRKDYEDTKLFRSARFAFPSKWPSWLKVRQIEFDGPAVGPFSASCPLTQAGDVLMVATPGHTMGHMSVILRHEGLSYFFAADAAFDQASLLNGTLDAPAYNSDRTLETRQQIIEYARTTPTVFLSTHDFDTEHRLNMREVLQV